jgi:hypothetical protein
VTTPRESRAVHHHAQSSARAVARRLTMRAVASKEPVAATSHSVAKAALAAASRHSSCGALPLRSVATLSAPSSASNLHSRCTARARPCSAASCSAFLRARFLAYTCTPKESSAESALT